MIRTGTQEVTHNHIGVVRLIHKTCTGSEMSDDLSKDVIKSGTESMALFGTIPLLIQCISTTSQLDIFMQERITGMSILYKCTFCRRINRNLDWVSMTTG
jgi:hypothetical protein